MIWWKVLWTEVNHWDPNSDDISVEELVENLNLNRGIGAAGESNYNTPCSSNESAGDKQYSSNNSIGDD